MLERVFPADVVTVEADEATWQSPLHPEEEAELGRVSDARRRDFGAGRACARVALERLGLPPGPLLRQADRSPRWPPGAVGSISHCPGFCAAAVGRSGRYAALGLDVERAGRARPELARRICTPRERAALPSLGAEALGIVFSIKEAVYKAWHPLTGTALGFQDVEVGIELEAGRFLARLDAKAAPAIDGRHEVEGRFAVSAEHVAAGLAVPRS
jgi:4'-phosphopantetheinyl transferase EntD